MELSLVAFTHGAVEDGWMRMWIGLLLILAGAAAIVAGAFTEIGDRDLWLIVLGGSAVFFGIGMLLRGAMRAALLAIGALLLIFGGGMALIDAL